MEGGKFKHKDTFNGNDYNELFDRDIVEKNQKLYSEATLAIHSMSLVVSTCSIEILLQKKCLLINHQFYASLTGTQMLAMPGG